MEFWPIDKFQGNILTKWQLSKNWHNSLYLIFIRKMIMHVLLTVFVTLISTFVNISIFLSVNLSIFLAFLKIVLITSQWAASTLLWWDFILCKSSEAWFLLWVNMRQLEIHFMRYIYVRYNIYNMIWYEIYIYIYTYIHIYNIYIYIYIHIYISCFHLR